ncbi:MAG TPA: SMR family transporter [bacterium]|nr:SMR family transporter [bacterium]
MHILFLGIALVFNALANILMKLANVRCTLPPEPTLIDKLTGLYLSWPFLGGLVLFGLNLVFYTQALGKMNLSIAYPIMVGTGFAIIGLTSYFLFHERLSVLQVTGILLILIGVILVARHTPALPTNV